MNRSYYNINSSNIISAKRVPSLTPPKAYPTSLSKEKTTKQIKDKAIGVIPRKQDTFNISIPFQNSLFLQQQNAILSARKATINLSESSEKLRKTSPAEKSPNNPRLSTMQKNKQINISQSQQAINQVLAQIQDSEQDIMINKKKDYIPEIESTQKSTLNSREFTNNSSKHKTEDIYRLQRENQQLNKRIIELEQKNLLLESVNCQLVNLFKMCECNKSKAIEVQQLINRFNQEFKLDKVLKMNDTNYDQNVTYDQIDFSKEKIKRNSYSHEYSEIKPQNLFSGSKQQSIRMDQVEEFFQLHQQSQLENTLFKQSIYKQQSGTHIPSVLQALAVSVNKEQILF